MRGDFSRVTFRPTSHYAGVLMQQGRVQVDADWNEQEAIQRQRTQIQARDVVGRCGAPQDDAGFAISISGNQLGIGAGRYYVDGLMAENDTDGSWDKQPDLPEAGDWTAGLQAGASHALAYLDVWERHVTPLEDALLREVALNGPDTASRLKTVWQVRVMAVEAPGGGSPNCDTPFKEWDELVAKAQSDPRMNARTQPPPAPTGPCVVPPTAGYRRLENQLYRVEVHNPGPRSSATFKWSRDNGSVVTGIEKMAGKEITVRDIGPDDILSFASGQWVEISDDRADLDGKPGQLAQVDTVVKELRRITLKTAPAALGSGADGVSPAFHPRLRRWDQNGSGSANGVAMAAAWLPLEDGIEIQFEAGDYRTGDYWVIPARTATGEIEWPPFIIPNTLPESQPRRGVRHHFCKLALLELDAALKAWKVLDDCRELFPPLTGLELSTPAELQAVHVARITTGSGNELRNDSRISALELATGIDLLLDTPIDPGTIKGKPTCLVSLDLPYPIGPDEEVWGVPRIGTIPLTLTAEVALGDGLDRITWRPIGNSDYWLEKKFNVRLFQLEIQEVLAHLTVKGNFVYADGRPEINLDGEVFGLVRDDVLDAVFPSGNGVRGGDLDMWFWLRVEREERPRDRIVLVPLVKARRMTETRRSLIPDAITRSVDRSRIFDAAGSDFRVNLNTRLDPEELRASVVRSRLGDTSLIVATEERLAPAAEVIVSELERNDLALRLEVRAVPDLKESFERISSGDEAVDMILAPEELARELDAAFPGLLAMDQARAF